MVVWLTNTESQPHWPSPPRPWQLLGLPGRELVLWSVAGFLSRWGCLPSAGCASKVPGSHTPELCSLSCICAWGRLSQSQQHRGQGGKPAHWRLRPVRMDQLLH